MAVPAGSILMLSVGGVLAYAGFTGQNPLEAVRDIATGHPLGVRNSASDGSLQLDAMNAASGDATAAVASAAAGNGLPQLPAALAKYAGDKYSQKYRNKVGYSDCSSFVGKGLKAIGIKPPPGSWTGSYLASKAWVRIPNGAQLPGDIAINMAHMVTIVSGTTAIGQENPRTNVKTGPLSDLMWGQGSYVFLRYHVAEAVGASGGAISSSNASSGKMVAAP